MSARTARDVIEEGFAALLVWVVFWPVFLAISIYDVWSER